MFLIELPLDEIKKYSEDFNNRIFFTHIYYLPNCCYIFFANCIISFLVNISRIDRSKYHIINWSFHVWYLCEFENVVVVSNSRALPIAPILCVVRNDD